MPWRACAPSSSGARAASPGADRRTGGCKSEPCGVHQSNQGLGLRSRSAGMPLRNSGGTHNPRSRPPGRPLALIFACRPPRMPRTSCRERVAHLATLTRCLARTASTGPACSLACFRVNSNPCHARLLSARNLDEAARRPRAPASCSACAGTSLTWPGSMPGVLGRTTSRTGLKRSGGSCAPVWWRRAGSGRRPSNKSRPCGFDC